MLNLVILEDLSWYTAKSILQCSRGETHWQYKIGKKPVKTIAKVNCCRIPQNKSCKQQNVALIQL